MKTSFIIITRNKREFLQKTLKTVYKNKQDNDEIIVIDDESNDGTMNMVKKHFSDIKYKRIRHKKYAISRMRNIGIKMAKFDRLVLMDDDLLLENGYIDEMKKYYNSKTLITGKFKREKKEGGLTEDWRITNTMVKKQEIEKDVYKLLKTDDGYLMHGICGVVMFSKKRAKEIGLYDTEFDGKWGAEDSFFGIKWAYYGGEVIYTAQKTAIHQYHPTDNEKKRGEQIENRELLKLMVQRLVNPKIAVMIHTFLRDETLKKCVNSIKENMNEYNYRIYISDGGNMTDEKREYYDELKKEGHLIMELPFDINWPAARNKMIKKIEEDYILYLDDDFILREDTNIEPMIKILKSNDKIGLVGGKVIKSGSILQYNFKVIGRPGELQYKAISNDIVDGEVEKYKYHYCDVMPNFWMAKKEIFNSGAKWDDELNIGGGHSIRGNQPVIIRNLAIGENEKIDVIPIQELLSPTKLKQTKNSNREIFNNRNIECWTENGWQKIKSISVHKCKERMVRLRTLNSFVECTEHHSLVIDKKSITPNKLEIGDKIELLSFPSLDNSVNVSSLWAWMCGFFLAEGFCGQGKRGDWKISFTNQNKSYLRKCKKTFELIGVESHILNTEERKDKCFFLNVRRPRLYSDIFSQFYTKEKDKKIPYGVYKWNKKGRKAFLQGFLDGDGNHAKRKNHIGFGQKSATAVQGLLFLSQDIFNGYSVDEENGFKVSPWRCFKANLFTVRGDNRRNKERNIIRKKEYYNYDGWVYDLEIENDSHSFSGGIGNVNLHNSDYFLNLKFNTKWKVVYNSDCYIYHEHEGDLEYHRKRKRKQWSKKFNAKWNSGNIIDIETNWEKIDDKGKSQDSKPEKENIKNKDNDILYEKNKIDFLIKTVERSDVLELLLVSIAKFYPDAHISIADDSKEFNGKFYKNMWEKLTNLGLKNKPVAYNLPFDSGLSFGRNFLIDHTKGEYVLILDDDFIFTEDTKIEKFRDILQAKNDIGIVGGMIVQDGTERHFEGNVDIVGRDMVYTNDEINWKKFNGIKYRETGCVFNFALMKREIFKEIKWDEQFKISGEHSDFYIRFNDLDWKIAYCPEVKITHRQSFNPIYKQMRKRKDFLKLLFKKYKCDRLIYTSGLCYEYLLAEDTIMVYRLQPNLITNK